MGRTIITQRDVLPSREEPEDSRASGTSGGDGISVATGNSQKIDQERERERERLDRERWRRERLEYDLNHRAKEFITGADVERRKQEILERWAKEAAEAEEARRLGADGYTDRLLKYIPAESVTLYLTLEGIVISGAINEQSIALWLWIIFGIGVVGTPFYLWRIAKVNKMTQITISTLAFIVWVFALGGAFEHLSWYKPFVGSVLLIDFTSFAPIISPEN